MLGLYKACLIDPKEENACYYLGRLYYTLSRFEDSLNAFDKALLVTESGEQWNRVTTSVGYGCSSDRLTHFGFGKDSVIKTIEIDWPSGIKQRWENIRADRFLTIEER